MIERLGDKRIQGRAAFLLVNVAACLFAATAVIEPLWTLYSERDGQITNQRRMLVRLQGIAGQSDYVRSVGLETDAQIRSGEFLVGLNENVISADLQTRLKTLIEAGGARPRAAQALPAKTVEGIRYVGARIEISGSIKSIYRAVYDVESARPYLFISGATIRSGTSVGKQGVAEEPVLQAQLDVFGAVQTTGHSQ